MPFHSARVARKQDVVCRILYAAQDLGTGSHRIWTGCIAIRRKKRKARPSVPPLDTHCNQLSNPTLCNLLSGIRTRAIGILCVLEISILYNAQDVAIPTSCAYLILCKQTNTGYGTCQILCRAQDKSLYPVHSTTRRVGAQL